MFLTFDLCRSKEDAVNISQNTGTQKKLMKTAAISLNLFNVSVPPSMEDESTTIEPNPTPDIYLGDSWFTSMDVVEHVKGLYIGNLKTNSSRYPKTYLQETMKDWPSGSYLNLKTVLNPNTTKERIVYAMGYKYCRSKVILFLFNEGAGHTECKAEFAYEAKWKDQNLNTHVRKVDRPHVAYLYFSQSNCIDLLNQAR